MYILLFVDLMVPDLDKTLCIFRKPNMPQTFILQIPPSHIAILHNHCNQNHTKQNAISPYPNTIHNHVVRIIRTIIINQSKQCPPKSSKLLHLHSQTFQPFSHTLPSTYLHSSLHSM
jgi:hypothetical protein